MRRKILTLSDIKNFVVIDVETTGLDPDTCEIIQLAAVRYRRNRAVEYYSTYVDPLCPIPPRITEITGITDEMVADAPAIGDVLSEFVTFMRRAPYVTAYNAKFDMSFLDAAAGCDLSGSFKWFDTMDAVKEVLSLPRYRLVDVCEYIGFDTQFHDALCDCFACGAALNYICGKPVEPMPNCADDTCDGDASGSGGVLSKLGDILHRYF